MNEVLYRLSQIGLVPVVKLSDAQKAVPLAKALVKGGIPCAEVTFRTEQAAEAMAQITENVPQMLVGAGTVTKTEQVDRALAAGAKFIVCPGLNPKIVRYCQEKNVPVVPGISSPTELEAAMELGLTTVKFFPAENLGGIKTIKAISAAYPNITFMPTGGVNIRNLNDYLSFTKIVACGGSWLTPADALAKDDYAQVTALASEAVKTMLGCTLHHIGVNAENTDQAKEIAQLFCMMFGQEFRDGNSSIFAGDMMEVMKTPGLGRNGHICIQVNSLPRAEAYFEAIGYPLDPATAKTNATGERVAIYFKQEVGGFAVHLLQKK